MLTTEMTNGSTEKGENATFSSQKLHLKIIVSVESCQF